MAGQVLANNRLIGAAIEAQRASRLVEFERPRHHEPAEANA